MSNRPSFSLTKALAEAAGGLPAAWAGAWLVLILLWAADAFGPLFLHHHVHYGYQALLIGAVSAVLKLMTIGALYRIALFGRDARAEGLGLGGVQLGLPEVRLLVANIVAGLFIMLIIATIFVVFAIGLNVSGAMSEGDVPATVRMAFARHQAGDWIVIAYGVAAYALIVFVAVKFSLLHAANIAQRRLVTLNALGLSTGQVGKLFIGFLVIVAPFVAIAVAVMHHFAPQIRLAHAMPYPWMGQQMHAVLHGGMVLLGVALLAPMLVGFFASAYRQVVAFRAK